MKCILAAGLLALSLAPGAASAATITAVYDGFTSAGGPFDASVAVDGNDAFVISFDDTLGSQTGILEAAEFVSFAWINDPYSGTRNGLRGAPTIAGLIDGFRTNGVAGAPVNWVFASNTTTFTFSAATADSFSLSFDSGITPDPDPDPGTVIPLPASAWLMIAALGGLGMMRRRATA